MKIPKIVNAIGHIDDELVFVAAESKKHLKNFKFLAACVAAVLLVSGIATALFINNLNTSTIDKRYKNLDFHTLHTAPVFEWEYLAESERNYEVEIGGIKYEKASGRTVSEEFIGEKIGRFDIFGYDGIMILEDERVTVTCDIYKLKDVSESEFIAVKIGEDYYSFKNAVYNPPKTLGELLNKVDISKFLELSRFYEEDKGFNTKHYLLNNDEYVWHILLNCRDARFIDADRTLWHFENRESLTFIVSSENLGFNKKGFAITNDGYLHTNIFDWEYLYYIGEEAAQKIIKYAKENSAKTEYLPYDESKKVYGQVKEITEDYILIDDTILCKNKKKGITYKILTDDIRFSRYFQKGITKIGDLIEVSYFGEIDVKNGNTVKEAFCASEFQIVSKKKKPNKDSSVSSVSHTLSSISQ